MEHEEHKDMTEKEEISPEMCVKMHKCMMADMMDKMKPKDEYDNMSDEDKDKADEKEVMGKH